MSEHEEHSPTATSRSLVVSRIRADVDKPGDVVVALVKKSKRTGLEVRLRDHPPIGRVVLLRVVAEDRDGVWRPTSDSTRCGVTIRADLLTRTIDALELAEDALAAAGLID